MKIGITGGAGFIGGHVADYCLANGHTPVIFDRRGRRHDVGGGRYLETFLGDVTRPRDIDELAKHVDGIIHLAAVLGTQETVANPLPSAETNTLGSLNVLMAVKASEIPMAYIGVGNWWMKNTYSISKTAVESFIHMFNVEHKTKINIVRAVNAYGPRQSVAPPYGPAKVRKITPAFVCRALLGEPIEVYGDGQQISDMVHVRDVARALVMALEHAAEGAPLTAPVEVGPTRSMSVNQVAHAVRQSVSEMYGTHQPPIKHLPMRPGETPGAIVSADNQTLRNIGIDPDSLTPFGLGIEETVQWFSENWLLHYQDSIKIPQAV